MCAFVNAVITLRFHIARNMSIANLSINQCIAKVILRGQMAFQKVFFVVSITRTCILIIGKLTPANKC